MTQSQYEIRLHQAGGDQLDSDDRQVVDAFVGAARLTFERLLSLKARPVEVHRLTSSKRPGSGDLSAVVGFTGARTGVIVLSFPEETALELGRVALGRRPAVLADPDLADAAGEVLNMIAGRSKRQLNDSGEPIEMTLPTVVVGGHHEVLQQREVPTLRIELQCEIGLFFLQVSLRVLPREGLVIVADDSRLQRRIVAQQLKQLDPTVTIIECEDGRTVLAKMATETGVRLVCLDLRMPGISGISVVEELQRQGSRVPVILITSDTEVERELAHVRTEDSTFPVHLLYKPLEADEFRPLASRYLGVRA